MDGTYVASNATPNSRTATAANTSGSHVGMPKIIADHHARKGERRGNADSDPEEREAQPLHHDQVAHVHRLRAERHTDPDFLRALLDRIGHQAVESHRGQKQRDRCEDREDHRIELSTRRGCRHYLVHIADASRGGSPPEAS